MGIIRALSSALLAMLAAVFVVLLFFFGAVLLPILAGVFIVGTIGYCVYSETRTSEKHKDEHEDNHL